MIVHTMYMDNSIYAFSAQNYKGKYEILCK